jgi:hypothetical protein
MQAVNVPGAPQNYIYLIRRGFVTLYGRTGSTQFIWRDGTFMSTELSFIRYGSLHSNTGQKWEGFFYKAVDANPFYMFFADQSYAVSQSGANLVSLPVYDAMYSFDDSSYEDWPVSRGALRTKSSDQIPGDPDPAVDASGNLTSSTGKLEMHGAAWKISLTHQEVQELSKGGAIASQLIPVPWVRAAILAAIAYVKAVDAIGGNKGVDITGVVGTSQMLVTPRGSIDIIHLIEVVAGVAKKVADQTNQAVVDAYNKVESGFNDAKAGVGEVLEHWGDMIGF